MIAGFLAVSAALIAAPAPPGLPEAGKRVLAPAGTPRAIVDRLNAEFIKASDAPKVKEIYATNAAEAIRMNPSALQSAMERDTKAWAEVVRATGVQVN